MTSSPSITLNNGVSIPQVGLGVFQVPPDGRPARGGERHRSGLPPHRHRRRVQQRVRGRRGHQVVRACRGRSCSSPPSCATGTRATTKPWRPTTTAASGWAWSRSICIWCTGPSRPRTATSTAGGRWSGCTRSSGSGRSGSPTSCPSTWSGCSPRPSWCRPSTRSSCIRPSSSASVADFGTERSIAVEAYSPLGQGADLEHPTVTALAESYGKTPAQIVLRWHVQRGHIVIPKSNTPDRIRSNFDVFDFSLTDDELDSITAMESGNRIGGHPSTFALSQIR